MVDHVNFAINLNPHAILLREAAPQFAWGIAKKIHTQGSSVNEKRTAALAYLRRLKTTLAGANQRGLARLPQDSPSRRIDFALFHFLATNLCYPDLRLARDLSSGMPLVGSVPATGVFTKRAREPVLSTPDWLVGLEEHNRAMVERVSRASNPVISRLCWEKSTQEVWNGWLSPPVPVTEAAVKAIPLSRRFAIEENHGGTR